VRQRSAGQLVVLRLGGREYGLVAGAVEHLTGRQLRERTPERWRWPLQLGLVTSGLLTRPTGARRSV
jgi:hypothetical protein